MPMIKISVEPLIFFLFLAVAGGFVFRRFEGLGRIVIGFSFVFLYALSTPLVGGYLLRSLELAATVQPTSGPVRPQAIVVLGAGVRAGAPEYGGDTVDRLSLERIRYAARLQRETQLPLLVSGGTYSDDVAPVSLAMKKALQEDFNVPVRWAEERSRNTFENAKFSAALLREEGIATIHLVTHYWHMPRAAEAFRYAGLNVVPASTGMSGDETGPIPEDFIPRTRALLNSAYALHEWVGRAWYHIAYY